MGCFGGGSKTKNVQPAKPPKCKKKPKKAWTQDEWKVHGKYLSGLSEPKKDYAKEMALRERRYKVPIGLLKPGIQKLSRPKQPTMKMHTCNLPRDKCHCHAADPLTKVSEQAKMYEASHRIKLLSQPKLDYHEVYRCFPMKRVACMDRRVLSSGEMHQVKPMILPRCQNLCTYNSDSPYSVKPEALYAKASRRTRELAQPKALITECPT
ncbi:uncharacterized protein LOC129749032 [Uranotaenia lowii]|uniref:uncharacterized protein LOC129749032 n=1 Tax=Uranotaenia lowii TaxID=190385 RepID=UPI00247AA89B|nr:uncharacterized protein LOC129749032 [Uranotaenia lowii]